MKYIPILFILFLLGCQQNPNIQKQIELQESLLDSKYRMMLADLDLKYTMNPAKYMGLFEYIRNLDQRFDEVQKEVLVTDGYGDKSKEIVFNYYKMVESGLTHGYLEDEFKKCRECINDILLGKSKSMEERKMTVLFLKTCHTSFIEEIIGEVTNHDFKFNKIRPVVVEKSNKVKLGEEYEARIFLIAIDTTKIPLYKIENCEVFLGTQGEGIVRYKANSKGNHVWGGTVSWVSDQGVEVVMDLEESFIVE